MLRIVRAPNILLDRLGRGFPFVDATASGARRHPRTEGGRRPYRRRASFASTTYVRVS